MNYQQVCDCSTPEEMQEKFEKLLDFIVKKFGGTKEEHRKQQLENVGYFSGYYSQEKMDQVKEWLGARHPIFDSDRVIYYNASKTQD